MEQFSEQQLKLLLKILQTSRQFGSKPAGITAAILTGGGDSHVLSVNSYRKVHVEVNQTTEKSVNNENTRSFNQANDSIRNHSSAVHPCENHVLSSSKDFVKPLNSIPMKNYDRFVLNSMRPTVVNTRTNVFAGFFHRICGAIVKMFNRSG